MKGPTESNFQLEVSPKFAVPMGFVKASYNISINMSLGPWLPFKSYTYFGCALFQNWYFIRKFQIHRAPVFQQLVDHLILEFPQ